jgi:rhodanese-related sulfurtransferase
LLSPKLIRFQSTHEQSQRPTISKEEPPKIYSYEDIKLLVNSPDPNKVIVDVREPVEFQDGSIPGAINIPYKSTPGALDLSPEEFEEAFRFPKPPKEKELIFYCLAGVRSTAAADLAQIFGYNKLGNYVGSYEDWVTHEQPAPPKDEQEDSK